MYPKKTIAFILTVILLCACFSACNGTDTTQTQPSETTAHTEASAQSSETTEPTEVSVQTSQPEETLDLTLLDQAESVGGTGNLMYIPNAHVESMLFPEILRCGNDILLYELMPTGLLQLKLVSLADGSLLAEASYSLSPAAQVQVENGIVCICDYVSGQVMILDDSLQAEKSYQVPVEGEGWFLDPETEVLYVFFLDAGLQSWDLVTGETKWLLENAAYVQVFDAENGCVLFSYTDRADQMTYSCCLDLSDAALQNVPAVGISSGVCFGEGWFLRQNDISGKYMLIQADASCSFAWPEGFCTLLSDKQQLFMTDGNYRELYLYDLNGNFLSRCELARVEYASVGTDLVWSDYWQGYFFQDNYDGVPHLMFWDPAVLQEGEDLLWEGDQPYEPVMEQEFYERAAALSERFGVEICIAEQCTLEYFEYQSNMLIDPYYVGEALNTVEQALGSYPEGFFGQLIYGSVGKIRIELVDGLTAKEDIITHPTAANGVAEKASDHYRIVLDGIDLEATTVYHEFSHLIDMRLEWDAGLRQGALFSEETWLSLQPEGFCYAYSYVYMPEEVLEFEHSGYFVRRYAMTYPTEDRATLMALVMDFNAALDGNPMLEEKMHYYVACIRDCFDTETWPEKTAWE